MSDIQKAIDHVKNNPLNDRNVAMNKAYMLNKLNNGDHFHFCCECGALQFANHSNKDELIKEQQCFFCNLWIKRSKKIQSNTLIVERQNELQMLTDGGECKRNSYQILGFGGARWNYFKLNNPDEMLTTNNMWFGGAIPNHMHHLFIANAVIK